MKTLQDTICRGNNPVDVPVSHARNICRRRGAERQASPAVRQAPKGAARERVAVNRRGHLRLSRALRVLAGAV
jgi:hypothetical protein